VGTQKGYWVHKAPEQRIQIFDTGHNFLCEFLSLNIQGINNKVTVLESFISSLSNLYFICITEHWLNQGETDLSSPTGYYCAGASCRGDHIRGGSLIYVHNKFLSRSLDVTDFYMEFHFEVTAVFVDELKLIIVCLYHSTSGDPNIFLEILDKYLLYLSRWSTYPSVSTGDFNENFDITKDKMTVNGGISVV